MFIRMKSFFPFIDQFASRGNLSFFWRWTFDASSEIFFGNQSLC